MTANHPFSVIPDRIMRLTANGPIADFGRTCLDLRMINDGDARFDERMKKLVKAKPGDTKKSGGHGG